MMEIHVEHNHYTDMLVSFEIVHFPKQDLFLIRFTAEMVLKHTETIQHGLRMESSRCRRPLSTQPPRLQYDAENNGFPNELDLTSSIFGTQ